MCHSAVARSEQKYTIWLLINNVAHIKRHVLIIICFHRLAINKRKKIRQGVGVEEKG